jgi:hypothetical protein
LWYLSYPNWPEPNLVMLNKALAQTKWTGEKLAEANWRDQVGKRLRRVGWDSILADVRPSVEPGFDLGILNLANLERARY